MKSIITVIGFVLISLIALGQSVSITSEVQLKLQSEEKQLWQQDLKVNAPIDTNIEVPNTILSRDKTYPNIDLQSDDVSLYLASDGILLDSDGTIAGIEFEITNAEEIELTLELEGFELIQVNEEGNLRAMIYSVNNTPMPSKPFLLVSFNQPAEAEWSRALAGNLNAIEVPVILNYGAIEMYTVTFDVDITQAMMEGQLVGFDPDVDHVFITGSMLDWIDPGSIETLMTLVSSDPYIYSMTIELAEGTYAYKYFSDYLGEGWDGGEWVGDPNRIVEITDDMTVHDTFEVGDAPEYTATFEVFDMEGAVIDHAVITFGGVENPTGVYVFEGVMPGNYSYDVVADGYESSSGEVTVGNADITVPVDLAPEVGIGEVDALELSIYPNPAREVLYIESGSAITGLRVIDIIGKVVYSSPVESMIHEINLSGFNLGVYLIQVATVDGVSIKRVVVSR